MSNLTLVVLAAGMGSRYGGLKQMDAFGPNGETLLEYSVYDALVAGFDTVVFVIRDYFAEEFKERVGNRIAQSVKVIYVMQDIAAQVPTQFAHLIPQREKPWGTAHAVLVTRDVVQTPFAVINADDFYGQEAYKKIATFLTTPHPQAMALVGYTLHNTLSPFGSVNRGVCSVHEQTLDHIVERIKIQQGEQGLVDAAGNTFTGDEVVSMNFRGFYPSFFDAAAKGFEVFLSTYDAAVGGEYFIPLVVDTLITEQQATCAVFQSTDKWCGVTNPEDKGFVQEHIAGLVAQGKYPQQLRPLVL